MIQNLHARPGKENAWNKKILTLRDFSDAEFVALCKPLASVNLDV